MISQKGYDGTTVGDLIELCGVSRSDFYKHFANKADCLGAAAEAIFEPALKCLRKAGEEPGDAASALFNRFIDLVSSQPAAARICFVELHAAGGEQEAVADRAFEALAEMVRDAGLLGPDQGAESTEFARVLVGGLRKLIHTRLYREETPALADLAPELWRWMTSIRPPAQALTPRRQRLGATVRFDGYTPAERIARAVAGIVAKKGYGATRTEDIAAEAAISLTTFYDHFVNKQDAVLAALEMSGAQIMASAVPAARRAGDWRHGVRALYEAMCAYFVAEPAMAQLVMVGVYGAGPQALAQRDRVIDSLVEILVPALGEAPQAPTVGPEAVGATVYALMREQVRRGGPESLPSVVPLATYISLAGFIGPAEASAIALGEQRRR